MSGLRYQIKKEGRKMANSTSITRSARNTQCESRRGRPQMSPHNQSWKLAMIHGGESLYDGQGRTLL